MADKTRVVIYLDPSDPYENELLSIAEYILPRMRGLHAKAGTATVIKEIAVHYAKEAKTNPRFNIEAARGNTPVTQPTQDIEHVANASFNVRIDENKPVLKGGF